MSLSANWMPSIKFTLCRAVDIAGENPVSEVILDKILYKEDND